MRDGSFSMTSISMTVRRAALAAGCVALAGCMDITVQNNNNPDRIRATNTPGDVQGLISGTFQH